MIPSPRIPILLVALALATAHSADFLIGGSVGAGWFTAPSNSSVAEALRPAWVLLGDTWVDRGPISLGLDVTLDLSNREAKTVDGLADKELLLLSSAVGMVGTTIPLDGFPASVRVGCGAGVMHSWNELNRGGQLFQQEGWGPEFHLAAIWERELGSSSLVRIRLAGIGAWTAESEILGAGVRSGSDWSRIEFSLGYGWKN